MNGNMPTLPFTKQDWLVEKEYSLVHCKHSKFGSCCIPCPDCGNLGFYGYRESGKGKTLRMYRACKFCGFWQEVDGKPYRCYMVFCTDCYAYDWHKPNEKFTVCTNCGSEEIKKIEWPAKNPTHKFWKEKERIIKKHLASHDIVKQANWAALKWVLILFGSAELLLEGLKWLSAHV